MKAAIPSGWLFVAAGHRQQSHSCSALALAFCVGMVLCASPVQAQHPHHATSPVPQQPPATQQSPEPSVRPEPTADPAPAPPRTGHGSHTAAHSRESTLAPPHLPAATPPPRAAAGDLPPHASPREPVPVLTDADRAAAFPPVHAHHAHGTGIHSYWLIDKLEVADTRAGRETGWEAKGWVGGDINKLWLRSEGHGHEGRVESADLELMYGRSVRPWWDLLAGVRQDFGDGPSRSWLGVGVHGTAPYKYEVNATVYVGSGGRTALRASAEYDTLLTNRLILQWKLEGEAHGRDDPALGIRAGLGQAKAAARLRYEITRKFAPYVGVQQVRAFGRTARMREAQGGERDDTQLVVGVRLWF